MTDLSFHIRQFVPDAEGEELEHRQALLVARDYAAMLRSRVQTEWAITLAAEAHETAGTYAFADTSCDNLKTITAYCRNLVQAAMLADWFDREGPGHDA